MKLKMTLFEKYLKIDNLLFPIYSRLNWISLTRLLDISSCFFSFVCATKLNIFEDTSGHFRAKKVYFDEKSGHFIAVFVTADIRTFVDTKLEI